MILGISEGRKIIFAPGGETPPEIKTKIFTKL
jgi:hypothetical protein